jgi:hypothetical protein
MFHRFSQQVADRDDADCGAALDHREVANAVRMHELQTVGKRVGRVSFDDVPDHDVRYGSGVGGFPGQHKAPHAITFGKNADDRPPLHDHDKSDILTNRPQSFWLGGEDLLQ